MFVLPGDFFHAVEKTAFRYGIFPALSADYTDDEGLVQIGDLTYLYKAHLDKNIIDGKGIGQNRDPVVAGHQILDIFTVIQQVYGLAAVRMTDVGKGISVQDRIVMEIVICYDRLLLQILQRDIFFVRQRVILIDKSADAVGK